MSDFDSAVQVLLKHEGGKFIDNDNGRGGSKWGVTLKTYQETHPDATNATIQNLGPEQAKEFYRSAFWIKYHIGLIEDQELATRVLDLSANLDGPPVIRMLQDAVGVRIDGILGPNTAAAVNAMPAKDVLFGLKARAADHYRAIAASNPAKYGKQLAGWISRLNS